MRYIYALKKQDQRAITDLKELEQEIRISLEQINVQEKKYIVINKESFEFSFSGCVPISHLQQMGRTLAKKRSGMGGFVRQESIAYAFLSYNKSRSEEERVLVEFADCSTIGFENESDMEDIPKWVRFYRGVELCTTYISEETAQNIFGEAVNLTEAKEEVFLVTLKHCHFNSKEADRYSGTNGIIGRYYQNKGNVCQIEHLYSAGFYENDFLDLVDIKLLDIVSGEEKDSILSKFHYEIDFDDAKQSNSGILNEENTYTFTVHNVGQALATSLSEKGKAPFFYFDYGIACRGNKFTLPTTAELPIAENATILLSHVDEDHWCGFRLNKEALKCRWVVPQSPTKALRKMLSSVYLSGGSISLYKAEGLNIFEIMNANNCMVAGNAKSQLNPVRNPTTVHENGNALYIFAEHDGEEYKIAVSGDQDYDYQNNDYLKDINLLVACHHGGKYSWSVNAAVPQPNTNQNMIVYSYGQGNTYGHPSKINEYMQNGWTTEHHTSLEGDYVVELKLLDNTEIKNKIMEYNPVGMEYKV